MFNSAVDTSKYETCEYNKSRWLKVFFHNHSTKVNFENEAEAMHCNSEYKYSILDEINPSMRINKKYEFIMDFPYDNVFIRWEQSKNPIKELDDKQQADGFKVLEHNLPSVLNDFRGLTRSTMTGDDKIINCFLDGVPYSSNWYFAVGMYKSSKGEFKDSGIPTYKSYTTALRLWIKIDQNGMHHNCTYNNKKYIHFNLFILNTLLITNYS